MIDRRGFLTSVAAASVAVPAMADTLPVPPGGKIGFRVLRNGTPIGEHHLTFTQNGDDLAVAISIALLVKFAGIPVFRYALNATERWSGGVFQSLESQVNDNGTQLMVHAEKTAAGYAVQGTKVAPYTAPANTMPLTYWNEALFKGTILNLQTAHSYPAIVTPAGWNSLPTAEGGHIVAQRFNVTGKLHLSVWYDQNNQWSGLEFHVSGDERYEKITT
ncbi:MAG: DUF6134 family protein [Acidocella sp.]|nr:DUF6134 family protein [Acidocella sp.]